MKKGNNLQLLAVLALFIVLAIGGCLSNNRDSPNKVDNPQAKVKIKVAQFADVFLYMPLYIAKDKGFFENQGLDVDIVSTGGDDKTYAAVIGGDAQFGIADPTFVAIARSKGQSGQVVASIVNGVPFWGVAKRTDIPEIKDPSMLKNYSVATFPAPSTAYVLQEEMFKKGGLKPNIKQAAFGTLLTQLESGQADIALELEPNVSTAVKQGARIVYAMPEVYGDFSITGVSVSEEMVQKNPEQVQKFVNAIQMALAFARTNTEETISLASKRFPSLDKEVVTQALKRMIDTNTLPQTTVISQDAWDKACNLRINSGELKASTEDARKTLNNSFSQKSIDAIKK